VRKQLHLMAAIAVIALSGLDGQTVIPAPAAGPTPINPGGTAPSFRTVDLLPLSLVGRPISAFIPALGNRLSATGLAETQLSGTISRPGQPDAPILVLRENPGLLRVEIGTGSAKTIAVIDEQAVKATATLTAQMQQAVESVLYDSAEYFLFDYANSGGARLVGSAFPYARASAQSRYQVFEKTENLTLSQITTKRTKLFYFNRTTSLLDYVRYSAGTGSGAVVVETGITWQKSGTEFLPASVERWEAGVPVLTIQFTQASVGPKPTAAVFLP
jgi:hypothetical protein